MRGMVRFLTLGDGDADNGNTATRFSAKYTTTKPHSALKPIEHQTSNTKNFDKTTHQSGRSCIAARETSVLTMHSHGAMEYKEARCQSQRIKLISGYQRNIRPYTPPCWQLAPPKKPRTGMIYPLRCQPAYLDLPSCGDTAT